MWTLLKIVASFTAISAAGFFMARLADSLVDPRISQPVSSVPPPHAASEAALPSHRSAPSPSASLLASYLESSDEAGEVALRKKLGVMNLEELEDFYIEALSFDLGGRQAYEAAGSALERMAREDPGRALGLLYALSSAEKERLAPSLAKGWARNDPLSAWDWVAVAWAEDAGEFIDRGLQDGLFREVVEVALKERGELQLAVDLVGSVAETSLKRKLAKEIARSVVSEDPSQALGKLDFESNSFVDTAIMDAIMDEWAQRDSLGAMGWALENETEVSESGARSIAKRLLLTGARVELADFHQELSFWEHRDSVAAESARLLARRELNASIDWLAAVESLSSRYYAYSDSLYEIGNDDFEYAMRYAELAHGVAQLDREAVLHEALRNWLTVDARKVKTYLENADGPESFGRLAELRESLN